MINSDCTWRKEWTYHQPGLPRPVRSRLVLYCTSPCPSARPVKTVENSPAIHRWVSGQPTAPVRPVGTVEPARFGRPYGTCRLGAARFVVPAVNCWAIVKCPYGAGTCRAVATRVVRRGVNAWARETCSRGSRLGVLKDTARTVARHGLHPPRSPNSFVLANGRIGWHVPERSEGRG